MISVHELVYNYPTKHYMGFSRNEMEDLLTNFPNINREIFDNSLRGVTGVMDEVGGIIFYHVNIERAIINGIRNNNKF
jgi:hypothetical protein